MSTPYLRDEHAPVPSERTDLGLKTLRGAIPEGLRGTFVRNSGNPRHPPGRYHWFDGDGMVHGVHLGADGASYRNRWIRTRGFVAEQEAGRPLWSGLLERPDPASPGGPIKDTANTDLIVWNGQLVATWWLTGKAMSLSVPGLDTRGPTVTSTGASLPRMCAHPKVDPRTGELVFMGFDPVQARITYGVASPDGRVHSVALDVPHAHVPHDLAITEHYTVLLDLPLGWSAEGGKRRIGFFRDRPSRFGVLPRYGGADEIRWLEHDACYAYHLIGAWEEGDEIMILGCRIADPIPERPTGWLPKLDTIELRPELYRWRLDLVSGTVRGEVVDDTPTEFPRVDDRAWGRPLRHAFHPRIARDRDALAFDGILRYDLPSGAHTARDWPAGFYSGEVVFAPRPGGVEDDDGWLVTILSSAREDASGLVVLDAHTLDEVALVALPWRVPLGFHAEWVPSGSVAG